MRNVRKMVLASLFASLCAVCSWIAIPMPPIYITLQTFAILLTQIVWPSARVGVMDCCFAKTLLTKKPLIVSTNTNTTTDIHKSTLRIFSATGLICLVGVG